MLQLGENEPDTIHKMFVSKPTALAQKSHLGYVGEMSLKTSVRCVVGIVKRQKILTAGLKMKTKYKA